MKKREENPIYQRQIQLLKKKYTVDDNKKSVEVTFHYEKASDLYLDDVIVTSYHEINKEVTNRMTDILSLIPFGYKANFKFQIDDYEKYSPKDISESFSDHFEENHYSNYGETKKKTLQITFLLLTGILLLIGKVAFTNSIWLQDGTTKEVILEIIDIAAWVFVWESVSIMFLSPSDSKIKSLLFQRKVKSISFIDKENKVLLEVNTDDLLSVWVEEGKLNKIEKYSLLIGGAGILGIGFSSLIQLPSAIQSSELMQDKSVMILTCVLTSLISIIYILSGISAISAYAKKGYLKKFLPIFGILNCLIVIVEVTAFVVLFVTEDLFSIRNLITAIFSVIFNFFYLVGFVLYVRFNYKNKKS